MTYNLTGIIDNSTSILGFVQGVNTNLTDGWLAILILIGISAVILIAAIFATNDIKKSVIATTFINFTLTLLFRALSLVKNEVIFIALVIFAIALAFGGRSS